MVYRRPLYLLPFDHRHSYVTGMFKFTLPLTQPEHDQVVESKEIIYDGFRQALTEGVAKENAGILVDEEFGSGILHDATRNGYVTALSVEKSGLDEFEFEYGEAFAEHIEAFEPTFAKVLVRYNSEDDAALNRRQITRLSSFPITVGARVSSSCSSCWCRQRRRRRIASRRTRTPTICSFVPG